MRRPRRVRGGCIEIIDMDSETNGLQIAASSQEFRSLLHRYRVLVSQLRLASKDFGDLSGVPKDHVAAALVVQESSAELNALHDKLQSWYARQNHASAPGAESVGLKAIPTSGSQFPKVGLVLTNYALDRKVSVIRVLRETVPGCSLTRAKALVEQALPAHIADGLGPAEAEVVRLRFEAVGATCRIAASGR